MMDMLSFMRIMDIIQLTQQKLEIALMILISLTWHGNMNMDQLWETVLVIFFCFMIYFFIIFIN